MLAHYARPVAAVLSDSEEDRRLRDLGWVPESHEADTLFQVAGVAQVARALRGRGGRAASASEPSSRPRPASGRGSATPRPARAAYADDWVGFRGIDVAPAHRRRGLAREVMAALVDWAAERGASTAYLQVLADNAPALALYAGLGFRTHHTLPLPHASGWPRHPVSWSSPTSPAWSPRASLMLSLDTEPNVCSNKDSTRANPHRCSSPPAPDEGCAPGARHD